MIPGFVKKSQPVFTKISVNFHFIFFRAVDMLIFGENLFGYIFHDCCVWVSEKLIYNIL